MNDCDFTFENFIVYDDNRTAYERALMVSECPGAECRNPLFIWGNTGLGKTHLLHAIRNKVIDKDPEKKVLYVKCETLVDEFIDCLKNNEHSAFREKYSSWDILLVDDFEHLTDNEGLGTNLFDILVKYIRSGKQLILSCGKKISDMSLSPRIKYLIRNGAGAQVQPPDSITRRIYLLNKINESENCRIDDAAINYLCNKELRNFREISGVVKIISACYEFEKLVVDLDLVKSVIDPVLKMRNRKDITTDAIIDEAARYYGVSRDEVKGPVDLYKSDYPQLAALYICFHLLGSETAFNGSVFNTSIKPARVCWTVRENTELRSDIDKIIMNIHNWQLENN